MKKMLFALVLALFVAVPTLQANAATINQVLPEYSSPQQSSGFPYSYHVGDFSYVIPVGDTIVSATVSGKWGNSINPTTAHNELYLDSTQVADTQLATPSPYNNFDVPWSYTFSNFSDLLDGQASFDVIMTSSSVVRLGETTLNIETAPVPEPSTAILGLLGIGGLIRRFRKK